MPPSTVATATRPAFLTLDDVAAMTHQHIDTVRTLARRGPDLGGIAARKVGRRWLVTPAALDAWLATRPTSGS